MLTACSSQSGSPAQKSTSGGEPKEVRIGYQVIPNVELLAKQLGSVEKQFPDTEIKWIEFDSGRDVNTAIASENIDLGLVGSVPAATGIESKLPYKVYYIHDVIGEAESLVIREGLNVKDVKDLARKKIAVPFGSTAHFSLLMALDHAGVDSNDLSILDMQPQDILAAWLRKDIDGAFVWHPTLGKLKEKGKVLLTAEQLAEKGIITADVGIVRNQFAEDYPEFLDEYVRVLDESVEQYRENPEKAAQTLSSSLGLTEQQTLEQMKGLVWNTSSEQQGAEYLGTSKEKGQFTKVLTKTGEFLYSQKIISSKPNLADYESAIYYSEK